MSGGAPRVVAQSDRRQPGGWWTLGQGSGWLGEVAQGVGDLGGRGWVGGIWVGHRGSARKCAPCRFGALLQVVSVIGRLLKCARTRYDAFAAGAPPGSPDGLATDDRPDHAFFQGREACARRTRRLPQGSVRVCRPAGRDSAMPTRRASGRPPAGCAAGRRTERAGWLRPCGTCSATLVGIDVLDGGDTVGTATPPGRGDGELW